MKQIFKTLKFAIKAHGDQKRKYTGEPYIIHPICVAELVIEIGGDENMICAALLHDVVEDTEYSYIDISEFFNSDILSLVMMLTDVSQPHNGNRATRKAIDKEHLSTVSPQAKTIKLADLINNSESIVQYDHGFAKVYMKEKRELLEVLKEGNQALYQRAKKIVDDYFKKV